jgi:hypothetical protein
MVGSEGQVAKDALIARLYRYLIADFLIPDPDHPYG